jgi:hypothetical protein
MKLNGILMKLSKRPDNEVFDGERGYYAKILPYGSNVGAPVIHPLDITPWKRDGVKRVNERLYTKFEELKREYEILMDELKWNELVYSATFNFEPIIGQVYYLYKKENEHILSIISPGEWGNRYKLEWVGSFQLGSDKNWVMIDCKKL